ncbi:methyl-accepting chemotaxis protein [Shimia sp. R9_1]|uniref:methyl-accepting chemotaxis protein n=1 Tax=Shimia sp. R9_1 TaxID=2821111 RepID=UPI001ADB00C1|nr:methyl-accepting chemotaxis protein [Shimia sp. R9_1]MBO9409735.1 methyl-accepting chemotaxis protein [Shimia sp. R9_1]
MLAVFKSVSGKVIASITAVFVLVTFTFSVYTVVNETRAVKAQILESATQRGKEVSQGLTSQLIEATSAAASLAGSLASYMESGVSETSKLVEIMRGVPGQYDLVFTSWFASIIDGPTEQFISGEAGRNPEGVFAPYWLENASGGLDFSPFSYAADTTEEWYAAPQSSGQSVITEPYLSSEGNLLTSVSVPVKVQDQIVGLAGVDIELGELSSFVNAASFYDGGRVMLLGQGGKWLANSDPALLTKEFSGKGRDAFDAAIRTGEPQIANEMPNGATRLFLPFSAYGMNKTWAVVLDVPREVFVAPVRQRLIEKLVEEFIMIALAILTVFLCVRSIVGRPIGKILNVIRDLSGGNVANPIELPKSQDEIGVMADSIEILRQGLAQKDALEAAQRKEKLQQEDVVRALANGLQLLASGHLDAQIAEQMPEEYERLRVDFNNTVEQLANLISSTDVSAYSIDAGLREITTASNDLAQRTEQSAAQLEETAAALDEMTKSITNVAQGAQETEQLVDQVNRSAVNSTAVARDTVKAMGSIHETAEKITQITGMIDDIAFQTNLLALNASVEAARAGDAGLGFAVVASEVRSLALRSSDAAHDIKELINTSSEQVGHGVELVDRTSASLEAMLSAFVDISDHVKDISKQASEQSLGISELNTAMGQLEITQQQNAVMCEETAAACGVLDRETSKLSKLVSDFRAVEEDTELLLAS